MRFTERVTEVKIPASDEKTIFGSIKDHKKDLESLHTVLAKFKESRSGSSDNAVSKGGHDFPNSVHNSSSKIKSLEAFLTSRRNSSKDKNQPNNSKKKDSTDGPTKAKKRLHLKDFSSSYGNINMGFSGYSGYKGALLTKFESANDSLVDQARPTLQTFEEPELVTIESADCLLETHEATQASESFGNQELGQLLGALRGFIRQKDERIRQLERENAKLKELVWPSRGLQLK